MDNYNYHYANQSIELILNELKVDQVGDWICRNEIKGSKMYEIVLTNCATALLQWMSVKYQFLQMQTVLYSTVQYSTKI